MNITKKSRIKSYKIIRKILKFSKKFRDLNQ